MLRWLGLMLLAVLLAATASYPAVEFLRPALNVETRNALRASGLAERFVSLPLGVMHIRDHHESGDAEVVLLVHGGTIGGYAFEHWQKPLGEAGYRVIVPDLLGYGFSDRPDVPYTKQFYIDQLDQLLTALEIRESVHIIGASLGGAIVTSFAAAKPDRVKSVTLLAPAGLGRTQIVNDILLWPVIGDWAFRVLAPTLTTNTLIAAYANAPMTVREGLAQWMAEQTHFRGYGDGLLNTLRNYDSQWQPTDFEALGHSGHPVLAVWGTADTVNPFAQSKTLLDKVPQTEFAALEGKSHAITFGETALVLAQVIPFLERVDEATSVKSRRDANSDEQKVGDKAPISD